MALSHLVLAAALAGLPRVDLETLKGDRHSGELREIGESSVRLGTGDGELNLPTAELLEVRFPDAAAKPDAGMPLELFLVDGSHLFCSTAARAGSEIRVESTRLGTLAIPLKSVANVRFGPADPKLLAAWNALCEKDAKTDLVVTRKGEVLDFLNGVIGEFDEKTVKFLLDNDEVAINRQKVYGLIYKRPRATAKASCIADVDGQDELRLTQVTWDGTNCRGKLVGGPAVTLPLDKIRALDFSLGKVRYLSQMEPRDVKYVPYFDVVWKYRRDRNLDGGPIRLGNTTYARGLSIHSRTLLRYRLGGEFRSFQAMMGIDQSIAREGDVQVTISGDGKELLKADVKGIDEPRPVKLDVAGVRDLEILVDFGGNLDIADHLDLADAKVMK